MSLSMRRVSLAATLAIAVTLLIPTSALATGGHHHRSAIVRPGESIQAAIDAAKPDTKIVVLGDHTEQIWINKDGIELVGIRSTLSMPEEPDFEAPCGPTLICVISPTVNPDDPFDPANYLDDVTVAGFTMSNPFFDSIGLYFTNGATVALNTVTSSDCSGIWMLFANDFRVTGNNVASSANCGNIDLAASTGGTVSWNRSTDGGFGGISLDDVSDVVVDHNWSTGNCIGIVTFDSPGELSASNVSITHNAANRNNTVCYPFGPDTPIGVAGILSAGSSNVRIAHNIANHNVSTDPAGTITPGGIVFGDFVDDVGDEIVVEYNIAKGNSTILGPLDINFNGVGTDITVMGNRCQYSAPNPDWCTH